MASLRNALPWHRAYRCYRNPQAASRCLYNEGTMSESVVSFTKPTSELTPYWLLQQLAAIDAVLILKFADDCACIKYDVPAERKPRDDYLSGTRTAKFLSREMLTACRKRNNIQYRRRQRRPKHVMSTWPFLHTDFGSKLLRRLA